MGSAREDMRVAYNLFYGMWKGEKEEVMTPQEKAFITKPDNIKPNINRCSKEHPMPKGAPGIWEHEGAKCYGECYSGCCDYWTCVDCGHSWKHEVPE